MFDKGRNLLGSNQVAFDSQGPSFLAIYCNTLYPQHTRCGFNMLMTTPNVILYTSGLVHLWFHPSLYLPQLLGFEASRILPLPANTSYKPTRCIAPKTTYELRSFRIID